MTICQANTQKGLLLENLLGYYRTNSNTLLTFLKIVNGESKISLRILDWCCTNYSKRFFVILNIPADNSKAGVFNISPTGVSYARFNLYVQYKLKLKAYSKRNFDPFCRWKRLNLEFTRPDTNFVCKLVSTLGQLNFFRWAISNNIIEYIEDHFDDIEKDMNQRNTMSKKRKTTPNLAEPQPHKDETMHLSPSSLEFARRITEDSIPDASLDPKDIALSSNNRTRKKREELSECACKSVMKENVSIVVRFH